MAFYLKKTKLKSRTYLSIDESFYSSKKNGTAHRCYKSLGSVETLISKGITDPIAHFQKEVDALNQEKASLGTPKISTKSPILHLGYFPLKSIMTRLSTKKYINYFKPNNDFQFDHYNLLSLLIYSKAVNPYSKTLPNLYEVFPYSDYQILNFLSFIGNNYQKYVEIFTVQAKKIFNLDLTKTYLTQINFETDNKPLTGLRLLLDSNQIPFEMEIFTEKENTVGVDKKTIYVESKGPNYIITKAEKELSEEEKEWILRKRGWKEVRDKDGNSLYSLKSYITKSHPKEKYLIARRPNLLPVAGINPSFDNYDILLTSEIEESDQEIYNTYRTLHNIKITFKNMLSDLKTIPKNYQNKEVIKGHILICYLTILLERIFEVKILENQFEAEEIYHFMKDFRVVKSESKYVNLATESSLIKELSTKLKQPLTNYFLSETQIKAILNQRR